MLWFDTILTSRNMAIHIIKYRVSHPVLRNKNDDFLKWIVKILRKETNQSTFIELISIGRLKHGYPLRVRLDGK